MVNGQACRHKRHVIIIELCADIYDDLASAVDTITTASLTDMHGHKKYNSSGRAVLTVCAAAMASSMCTSRS